MALRDLGDPQAVIDALDEFDRIDRTPFLKKYGFGRAQWYFLRRGSRLYDSKAIAAAAHGYQFGRPLRNYELYGGRSSAVRAAFPALSERCGRSAWPRPALP